MLLVPGILAGCGGGGAKPTVQTLQGAGFRFQAPAAWTVVRNGNSVAAKHGPVDRVEVLRFRTKKRYAPSLFPAVTRELDGVIAGLAKQLSGRVKLRSTIRIAARPVRSYRIDYGAGKTEEIAFVFEGQTEFYLLCRRLATDPAAPCKQLFKSFSL
jgi:hypothetical protein